jgi:hypothetical protein
MLLIEAAKEIEVFWYVCDKLFCDAPTRTKKVSSISQSE